MNAIKFNLRSPKGDRLTTIFLVHRMPNQLLKVSTGLKVHPSYWNFKTQKVKKSHPDSKTLNEILNSLKLKVRKRILQDKLVGRVTTAQEIKHDVFGKVKTDNRSTSLLKYMAEFIEVKKETWSRSTYLNYLNTLKVFKVFFIETGISDEFDSVNLEFYNRYLGFLYSEPRSYSINNAGKHIQNIKAVMNAAVSEGRTQNMNFKHQSFKKPIQVTVQIYLTLDELELIRKTKNLSNKLENARDCLIALCYSGLRFGDLYKINASAIRCLSQGNKNIKVIEVLVQKTGSSVVIPLHPYIEEILNKYDGRLPKFSNTKLNVYIKEVARLAGIDSVVSITTSRAGKPIEIVKPKHELICTHIGRRSMITNMYLSNIDTQSIRMISGHSTEKEFQKYIRVSLEQNSVNLSKHKFFSRKTQ